MGRIISVVSVRMSYRKSSRLDARWWRRMLNSQYRAFPQQFNKLIVAPIRFADSQSREQIRLRQAFKHSPFRENNAFPVEHQNSVEFSNLISRWESSFYRQDIPIVYSRINEALSSTRVAVGLLISRRDSKNFSLVERGLLLRQFRATSFGGPRIVRGKRGGRGEGASYEGGCEKSGADKNVIKGSVYIRWK